VGINGAQGSGKTTLSDYLCHWLVQERGLRALSLSIDDVYLTRRERQQLALDVHPLLLTRGVPGTHDIRLLLQTLEALGAAAGPSPVAVPRFDKASDDRLPQEQWPRVRPPLDVILLEGWCLGVQPQGSEALAIPCNALEQAEDSDGRWRRHVNECLAGGYALLHQQVDVWLMLRAPSFDEVLRWRSEQEQKLAAALGPVAGNRVMDEPTLARFVQHYERLTRHCLATLPPLMDLVWELDRDRMIRSWHGSGVPT
jgi:D-glycerate 3-kinase